MSLFFKKRRVPAFCMMALIVILSSIPADTVSLIIGFILGPSDPNAVSIIPLDKLLHFSIYFLLGLSYAGAIHIDSWGKQPVRSFVIVILLSACFGVMDEMYQRVSNNGRQFEYADMGVDVLGSFISASLFVWKGNSIVKRYKRMQTEKAMQL